MALPRSLPVLAVLVVVAVAAVDADSGAPHNLTTYMPECTQPCWEQTIKNNGLCAGSDDSQCLCTYQRTIGLSALLVCAQTPCSGNTTDQLKNAFRSSFAQYCSDTGSSSPDSGIPSNSWFASFPRSTSTSTSRPTSTPTSASTTPPSTTQPSSTPNSAASSGGSSPSLSQTTITSIIAAGVTAGVLVVGGLLVLSFCLGRRNRKRHRRAADPHVPESQKGAGSGTGSETATLGDKPQLDGNPVSELHTEYTISGTEGVKELPTIETPVELSADPVPCEKGDAG
ncbi:hypothetical protein GGR54DRAFT_179520 [Hypoxylon sp. NC1633]|nr:hypothetical protein GGR54DRAFT_179520 [Hypoxylon sp. NC1633]